MDSQRTSGAESARRAPWRRRLAVALVALAGTWIAADLALAHLLFGRAFVPGWAAELRVPALWAGDKTELYYRLTTLWGDRERDAIRDELWKAVGHPELGWVAGAIDPETLAHDDARALAGRRPILLYGDSFARGVGARTTRFQGLCERSDLAADFALLNYGLGGYGTDQTYLLLRATVELYREHDPVVVYSFLVDDDLDRAPMGYKSGVRPRLVPAPDGGVVRVGGPCSSVEEYFERHPTPRLGYAWRLVRQWPHWPEPWRDVLSGERARIERVHELHRHLFTALKRELDALGVEWFVLVFHGEEAATLDGLWEPHEAFVLDTLTGLGIPFVSTRRDLLRTAREHGAGDDLALGVRRLFVPRGDPGGGHYTPLGHVAAFETLRRGLEGRFQTERYEWPEPDDGFRPHADVRLPAFREAAVELPDATAAFRIGGADDDPLYRIGTGRRPGGAPTRLTWNVGGFAHALRFHASVQPRPRPQREARAAGPLRVVVEADGETLLDATLHHGEPLPVQAFFLRARDVVTLSVAAAGDDEPGWLVLRNAELR